MRITKKLEKDLIQFFTKQGYQVRIEKGKFQGGYCVVYEARLIVLNRYYTLEDRVRLLLELLETLPINPELVEPEDQRLLKKLSVSPSVR